MPKSVRRLVALSSQSKLAQYLIALWLLLRDHRTPRLPKLVAGLVVLYALSPIDLIPDFIPVLGQLDDLILIPLGVTLVVKLTPDALWADCMSRASTHAERLPKLRWGIAVVVGVWLALLALIVWGVWALVQ
jgi:uncharacterized membrane protein YkvA (DUF1232 family)